MGFSGENELAQLTMMRFFSFDGEEVKPSIAQASQTADASRRFEAHEASAEPHAGSIGLPFGDERIHTGSDSVKFFHRGIAAFKEDEQEDDGQNRQQQSPD